MTISKQVHEIHTVDAFDLESGITLRNVPVAYTTYGHLSARKDNVIIVCHALSGGSNVEEWWPQLLGPGRALDPTRFFIICLNSLGSPYGTASPLTFVNGDDDAQGIYGPEFPIVTVRDDVALHQRVLRDQFKITQIAAVIGPSMGGMLALEWVLMFADQVQSVVLIATTAQTSPMAMAYAQVQRQAIQNDPKFQDGWYHGSADGPPVQGLATARQIALLTYRSHPSFNRRFLPLTRQLSRPDYGVSQTEEKNSEYSSAGAVTPPLAKYVKTEHAVHSYLDYQGQKFNSRFDANCYLSLMDKIDSHDICRGRVKAHGPGAVAAVLNRIWQPTLVVGITTDLIFPIDQQIVLARDIPGALFEEINSKDGHDGFLIEGETVGSLISSFLDRACPL